MFNGGNLDFPLQFESSFLQNFSEVRVITLRVTSSKVSLVVHTTQ